MKSLAGLFQVFWNDLRFTNNGHEVGVSPPSGNNVEVNMVDYACSCHPSQVDPDVEPMRSEALLQDLDGRSDELKKLSELPGPQARQVRAMSFGSNDQMAVVVGEFVHHHKGMPGLVDNEFALVCPFPRFSAEDTAPLFLLQDVLHPPRRPESVHVFFSTMKMASMRPRKYGEQACSRFPSDRLRDQLVIEIEIIPPCLGWLIDAEDHREKGYPNRSFGST